MDGYIKKQALLDYARNQIGGQIDMNDIARFPCADVVPKSEVFLASTDAMTKMLELHGYAKITVEDIEREVAKEIFEAVDSMLELVCAATGIGMTYFGKYAELKKKYTEDKG